MFLFDGANMCCGTRKALPKMCLRPESLKCGGQVHDGGIPDISFWLDDESKMKEPYVTAAIVATYERLNVSKDQELLDDSDTSTIEPDEQPYDRVFSDSSSEVVETSKVNETLDTEATIEPYEEPNRTKCRVPLTLPIPRREHEANKMNKTSLRLPIPRRVHEVNKMNETSLRLPIPRKVHKLNRISEIFASEPIPFQ